MAHLAVVDDNADLLHVMQDTLAEHGWDADIAVDEHMPFADLQAQHPDLIILDLWLDVPEERWKLLHHLKRKRSTRDIPIIICTGAPERLASHDAWFHQHGVTILSTPCDTRELDRAIALQLGQQRPSDKCQACLPDNSAPGQWEEHGASREQHPARTTIGRGWEGSDSASRRSCWSCRC